MNTIECYQCDSCKAFPPKDTAEFIIIESFKLTRQDRIKPWISKVHKHLITEYSGDLNRIFCNSECFHNYINSLLKEKK